MTAVFVCLFLCGQVGTESAAAESGKSELRNLIDESIDWYEVYPSDDSDEAAKKVPALRWTSPTRPRTTQGLTLLHVDEGRPVAVTSVFPWGDKWLAHEFDSLSRRPIEARENGRRFWHPLRGLDFQAVPDAPTPADSKAARLRQMKVMARDFGSTLLGLQEDDSDREALRQLPKPLYRYDPPEDADVLDGMIIVFAIGTDPESLLLLEAFKVDEHYQWQYCFVRQTIGALNGSYRNNVVWNFPKFPPLDNPHSTVFGISKPLPAAVIKEVIGDQ